MEQEHSLREIKYARTKIALMRAFIERLKTSRLDDISVQEICKTVEISEGTFFNYFPEKVDIINYQRRLFFIKIIWLAYKYAPKGRHLAMIETAFEKLADESAKHNINIVYQMISIMLVTDGKPAPVRISGIEKRLAFPDLEGIEEAPTMFIDDFYKQCLEKAAASGELPKKINIDDLLISLLAIMGGTVLASKLQNIRDRKYQYIRQLRLLWKGLGVQVASLLVFLGLAFSSQPCRAEENAARPASGLSSVITIS